MYAIFVREPNRWRLYVISSNDSKMNQRVSKILESIEDKNDPIDNYKIIGLPDRPLFNE